MTVEPGVGSELAGFRIEALLGRGGMGVVYRATQLSLEREVALKLIAPELASQDAFRERFLREARLAASLEHPHVLPVYEAGEAEGVLFLALRYIEAEDLGRLLEHGPLSPERACRIVSQLASALEAAHERGLVHRDVKPANVLLVGKESEEHVYLTDFGLAKPQAERGMTKTGEFLGSVDYLAPEQIERGESDERSDIYALGCLLYACLTGAPPFRKEHEAATLWAHLHEPPPTGTPYDDVLALALAKDPRERFQSAAEFARALAADFVPMPTRPTAAPKSTLSRRLVAGVAAFALAAAVAVLVLLFAIGSDTGGLTAISPNAVGVIDPRSNELVAEVPVGLRPGPLAAGGGAVWVANTGDETISRIDPRTRRVIRTLAAGGYPTDMAVGAGSVWVFLARLLEFTRIAPEFDEATNFPVRGAIAESGRIGGFLNGPCYYGDMAMAVGRSLWFVCNQDSAGRVDIPSGKARLAFFDTGTVSRPLELADVVFGLGSLWLVNRATNSVWEIDPALGQIRREITVGQAPGAVAVGAKSLWVTNLDSDMVTRVHIARTGAAPAVTAIPVGDGPVDVAYGVGAAWVANSIDGTVSRIDSKSNEVVATIEVGDSPQRIAAGEAAVWVTFKPSG